MLASSSAASTSSRTQNGLGRLRKIASKQRHAGHRLFAAAEQRNAARLLAGRPGDDLDAAVQNIDVLLQHDVGVPAAEQVAEQRLEMPLDGLQRLGKQPPAVGVDPVDDLLQRRLAGREVLVLVGEQFVAASSCSSSSRASRLTLPRLLIFCRSSSISCCTSSRCCRSSPLGSLLQRPTVDAVILAHPVGQACSARGGPRWPTGRRRESSLPACGGGRGPSEFRPPARSARPRVPPAGSSSPMVCAVKPSLRR